MKILALLPLAVLLAGCGQERVITRTVTVTNSKFIPLDPGLLPEVEPAVDPASVLTNGQMWNAWQHDAGQLGICKPALDGIRKLQPKS